MSLVSPQAELYAADVLDHVKIKDTIEASFMNVSLESARLV